MGTPRPVAIDLYAGVGGWALGLQMAGVEVTRSYEWWAEAAATHEANIGHMVTVADIRSLPLSSFPQGVDYVVGSPPCTQFSYANRGGNGDIQDGLRDIEKFLEVVRYVQPRSWAMENVPRVARVLERELASGGTLERFADLFTVIEVVDSSDWGVPQRRRRMIAGNFDFARLQAMRGRCRSITLRQVLEGIAEGVRDPVWGWSVPVVTDNVREAPLNAEELRMNREQKRYHRVYNKMPFPEPLDRPSRTVTALCTRVSRESLVVADGDQYRRLTVRERASLQSFPVGYQFQGRTHSARIKMVGNAIPPLLTFFIAHALQGSDPESVMTPLDSPTLAKPAASANPPRPARRFAANRKFAAAVPGLRFGSGTRIELRNVFQGSGVYWEMSLHYGPSKAPHRVSLDEQSLGRLKVSQASLAPWFEKVEAEVAAALEDFPQQADALQHHWLSSDMMLGPYGLVDRLGQVCTRVASWLPESEDSQVDRLLAALTGTTVANARSSRIYDKLRLHFKNILAGAVVGGHFNQRSGLAETAQLRMVI